MSKKVREACADALSAAPDVTDDDLIEGIRAIVAIAKSVPVNILITAHANGYQTLNVSGTNDKKLLVELISRALTKVASAEAKPGEEKAPERPVA